MRDFLMIMGAVLAANLLTVCFLWGIYSYSKLEREGREYDPGVGAGTYLGAIILPLAFLIGIVVLSSGALSAHP